jgi:hypothetical protein
MEFQRITNGCGSRRSRNPGGFQLCPRQDINLLPLKAGSQKQLGGSSVLLSMNCQNLSLPRGNNGQKLSPSKHQRISASVSCAPLSVTSLNAVICPQNRAKKCQQKCQQISSRGVRGEFSTSSPVLIESSSISVPKSGGEGRRFRPSPPFAIS